MATTAEVGAHRMQRVPYWHLLPFFVFIALNAAVMVYDFDKLANILDYLNPFAILLMALATYRIADIISNERVTQVFRAPFVNVKREDGEEVEVPKPEGVLKTIGTLLYCPSCVGVWVATALVYLFIYLSPVAWVVCAIFTLSAGERLFTTLIRWLQKLAD